MTASSAVPTRRTAAVAAAALLVLGAVGGGLVVRALAPPAVASPLLDARLPLASEGVVFPFTIDAPTGVRVTAGIEHCTSAGEAIVAPLLPANRPHWVLEPDPEHEVRLAIPAGETVTAVMRLSGAGAYVVRVPGIPRAMGGGTQPVLHVRVEVVPWEGEPAQDDRD